MPTPNQISRQRDDVHVKAEDLLKVRGSRDTNRYLDTLLCIKP